jgi:hypothetical protein
MPLKPFFFIPVFDLQEMGQRLPEPRKVNVPAVGSFTVEINHAEHIGE